MCDASRQKEESYLISMKTKSSMGPKDVLKEVLKHWKNKDSEIPGNPNDYDWFFNERFPASKLGEDPEKEMSVTPVLVELDKKLKFLDEKAAPKTNYFPAIVGYRKFVTTSAEKEIEVEFEGLTFVGLVDSKGNVEILYAIGDDGEELYPAHFPEFIVPADLVEIEKQMQKLAAQGKSHAGLDEDISEAGGFAVNRRGRKLYDTKGDEAGEKDIQRMRDLKSKAAGNEDKAIRLAEQMAKLIQDAEKALRRADAAETIFDGTLGKRIANIFKKQAKSLAVVIESGSIDSKVMTAFFKIKDIKILKGIAKDQEIDDEIDFSDINQAKEEIWDLVFKPLVKNGELDELQSMAKSYKVIAQSSISNKPYTRIEFEPTNIQNIHDMVSDIKTYYGPAEPDTNAIQVYLPDVAAKEVVEFIEKDLASVYGVKVRKVVFDSEIAKSGLNSETPLFQQVLPGKIVPLDTASSAKEAYNLWVYQGGTGLTSKWTHKAGPGTKEEMQLAAKKFEGHYGVPEKQSLSIKILPSSEKP